MPKKVTKKRNSGRGRRSQQRQERLITIAVAAFLFLCVGSFVSIRILNDATAHKSTSEWYVEDGQMEILAAPVANTLDMGNAGGGLPFLESTPAETPQPTLIPMPTPVPTDAEEAPVEPEATPQPESTMPVVAPVPTREVTTVPITITAVGDCTLGGDIPTGAYRTFESYADRYGYDYFFENVRDLFESDDLTIVNLEGPLTTSDDMRSGRAFNFRGDPEYVKILSGSSVEIANVANNHAMDFGESGFSETAEVLKAAGIGMSGFSKVYLTEVKGVTVCSIGFTEWAYSEEQIRKMISLARPNCDLLIVSVHWGTEGSHETTRTQERLGHAMIDAGADIVLGTHPHVYGGVELYKGKYIVYSLGNFCFGGNRNPRDKNCLIFQQTFNVSSDGTVEDGGISIIPAMVSSSEDTNDFQPMILTDSRAKSVLGGMARESSVDLASVRWMEDGYQVQTGMVTLGQN